MSLGVDLILMENYSRKEGVVYPRTQVSLRSVAPGFEDEIIYSDKLIKGDDIEIHISIPDEDDIIIDGTPYGEQLTYMKVKHFIKLNLIGERPPIVQKFFKKFAGEDDYIVFYWT